MDGLVPIRFVIFTLHLSKVLRLPRKVMPGQTKSARVTQSHFPKIEDLTGPPNIVDVQYVSSTAPAPLDGFRRATNLPRPKAWAMAGGTLDWTRRPQTWVAGESSNKILAISAVSPGPGCCSAACTTQVCGKEVRWHLHWAARLPVEDGRVDGSIIGLLRFGFWAGEFSRVLAVPGASGSANSACHARDSSETRVGCMARFAYARCCLGAGWPLAVAKTVFAHLFRFASF